MRRLGPTLGALIIVALLAGCGGGGGTSGGADKKAACDAVYNSIHQLSTSSALTDWGNGKAASPTGGVQPVIDDLKSLHVNDSEMKTKINAEIDALTKFQVVLETPISSETADSIKGEGAIADAALDSAKNASSTC